MGASMPTRWPPGQDDAWTRAARRVEAHASTARPPPPPPPPGGAGVLAAMVRGTSHRGRSRRREIMWRCQRGCSSSHPNQGCREGALVIWIAVPSRGPVQVSDGGADVDQVRRCVLRPQPLRSRANDRAQPSEALQNQAANERDTPAAPPAADSSRAPQSREALQNGKHTCGGVSGKGVSETVPLVPAAPAAGAAGPPRAGSRRRAPQSAD